MFITSRRHHGEQITMGHPVHTRVCIQRFCDFLPMARVVQYNRRGITHMLKHTYI